MKKLKFFGIGAAALMLLIAFGPMTVSSDDVIDDRMQIEQQLYEFYTEHESEYAILDDFLNDYLDSLENYPHQKYYNQDEFLISNTNDQNFIISNSNTDEFNFIDTNTNILHKNDIGDFGLNTNNILLSPYHTIDAFDENNNKKSMSEISFVPEIPDEIEEIYNELIEDLSLTFSDIGGGITDYQKEFHMWWFFPGNLNKLWLDHDVSNACAGAWDVNQLLIVSILGLYLGSAPGFVVGVAIGVVLILLDRFSDVDTNPFDIYDHGNGVYMQWWTLYGSMLPTPPLGIDLYDFSSQ